MKSLFPLGIALLLSTGGLIAQELMSLDEYVKAAGLTPTISGGTSGTHYHASYAPAKAFDGVSYSTDYTWRWLGNIKAGTYLQYGIPDGLPLDFIVRAYRVHTLSCGDYNKIRAPRSWALYGHADAAAAADDAGWVLLDEQADVVWPFDDSAADFSDDPAAQFVLEFTLATPAGYRAYKFVPLSSERLSANDAWNTGLMELVFLGAENTENSVTVEGVPEAFGEVSPAYGMYANLPSGTNITFTAPARAYSNGIRYRCAGYTLETQGADGEWLPDGTNLNVNTFTYVNEGAARRVTWLWEEDGYRLTTGLEFEGSESVSVSLEPDADGYYPAGTELTLTPVIPEGAASTFKNWYGDVPAGMETRTPLTITMDAVTTIYADFTRRWSIVPDVSNQITDGNWTLRLNPRSDGTYSVGNNDANRARIAGSGFLDLTTVEADTGLTLARIATSAFRSVTNLITVAVPDTVIVIDENAFRGCTGLESARISANLTTLGPRAFSGCSALQTVTPFLPDTLTAMRTECFNGCRVLEGDLKLQSAGLKSVDTTVFNNCYRITSVDMSGSGVTSIGGWSFQNCRSLTNAVLPAMVASIGERAFYSSGLVTVTPFLPDTVKSVGGSAFSTCTNLVGDLRLKCPELTSTGYAAFTNCSQLDSVDMGGSGIVTIGDYAFSGCWSMTNAVIPSGLQRIGLEAFLSNSSLRTVTPFLPDTVQSVGGRAFSTCTNLVGDLRLKCPELTSTGTTAFTNCSQLDSVDMGGSGIVTIGEYAFSGCSSITNVVLSSILQYINQEAFLRCYSLVNVEPFLPKSLVTVRGSAFNHCEALSLPLEITNKGFTSLGISAFAAVPLTKITLPDATFTISEWVFSEVPVTTPVYFLGKAPTAIGAGAFNPGRRILYACRRMDEEGWANRTTALTDSDLSNASYPGPGTFGVLLNNTIRHWLVHWSSPEMSGPVTLILH